VNQEQPKLLELDGRRRISLGALARHNYYFAEEQDDGVIVLTPAVVMPAAQAERIDDFLDHPETGTRRVPNQPRRP
jgi:hypothetical protein